MFVLVNRTHLFTHCRLAPREIDPNVREAPPPFLFILFILFVGHYHRLLLLLQVHRHQYCTQLCMLSCLTAHGRSWTQCWMAPARARTRGARMPDLLCLCFSTTLLLQLRRVARFPPGTPGSMLMLVLVLMLMSTDIRHCDRSARPSRCPSWRPCCVYSAPSTGTADPSPRSVWHAIGIVSRCQCPSRVIILRTADN